MSLWLVVPVKSLRDGKTRLAPALDPVERSVLVERLLLRTLGHAAQFTGLERTLVVSACQEARARASACGAHVLEENAPGGLNSALRQARLALGASRMLMVSCDLPLLSQDDLHSLTGAAREGTIAIAPDRTRQGTNGLCLPASLELDFCFGPNSFQRHRYGAQQLGLDQAIVDRIGLAFDVDTPEDLLELRVLEPRSWLLGSMFETASPDPEANPPPRVEPSRQA